jgi:hypothetical protein
VVADLPGFLLETVTPEPFLVLQVHLFYVNDAEWCYALVGASKVSAFIQNKKTEKQSRLTM